MPLGELLQKAIACHRRLLDAVEEGDPDVLSDISDERRVIVDRLRRAANDVDDWTNHQSAVRTLRTLESSCRRAVGDRFGAVRRELADGRTNRRKVKAYRGRDG